MKPSEIIRAINELFEINIKSTSRHKEAVYARFIYFKLCKELEIPYSLAKIGYYVNRNHATVIHGLKQYEILLNYEDFKEMDKKIRLKVGSNLRHFNSNFISSLNLCQFEIIRHNETIHN